MHSTGTYARKLRRYALLASIAAIVLAVIKPGYSTYRERLASVTAADVGRIGTSHLKPDALTIVAVGDLKTIEAPIRALNLGAVEVWDTEGKKIR